MLFKKTNNKLKHLDLRHSRLKFSQRLYNNSSNSILMVVLAIETWANALLITSLLKAIQMWWNVIVLTIKLSLLLNSLRWWPAHIRTLWWLQKSLVTISLLRLLLIIIRKPLCNNLWFNKLSHLLGLLIINIVQALMIVINKSHHLWGKICKVQWSKITSCLITARVLVQIWLIRHLSKI